MASYGESNIDLTFLSADIYDCIHNWKVETIETNSDHNYITFEFESTLQTVNSNQNAINSDINSIVFQQIDNKYCMKKFDINSFKENISKPLSDLKCKLNTINNIEDIEHITSDLMTLIIQTCNQLIPRHKVFKKSNNWWSTELWAKRKHVNHLRRRYQRCSDQIIRQNRKLFYYSERQTYVELIRKSKLESWRKFCFESNTWDLPYKILNNKLKIENSIPNFQNSDGTYTQTHEESLQYALAQMFPNDDPTNDNEVHKSIRHYTQTDPQTVMTLSSLSMS